MDKMTNFNNGGIMPEILLDFSKSKLGQMNIDIKFNESLSKERKKIEKNFEKFFFIYKIKNLLFERNL